MNERMRLLTDNSLSDQARLIGFWLIEQGEGWHELKYSELSLVLNGYPGGDTVGKHVRQLVNARVVERRPGGRGHGDTFRWVGRTDSPRSEPPSIEDRGGQVAPGYHPRLSDRQGPEALPKDDSPRPEGGAKPLVVGVEVRTSGEEVVETPPVVPPKVAGRVSEKAERVIQQNGEKLEGCRGPLRDYLTERVDPGNQFGYVQTLVTWLDGGDPNVWRTGDGGQLTGAQRAKILGTALNELLAGDEKGMAKPMGHTGNLRNKIWGILKGRRADGSGTSGTGGGPSGGQNPARGAAAKPRGRGINERWERGTGTDGPTGGARA